MRSVYGVHARPSLRVGSGGRGSVRRAGRAARALRALRARAPRERELRALAPRGRVRKPLPVSVLENLCISQTIQQPRGSAGLFVPPLPRAAATRAAPTYAA